MRVVTYFGFRVWGLTCLQFGFTGLSAYRIMRLGCFWGFWVSEFEGLRVKKVQGVNVPGLQQSQALQLQALHRGA